MRLVNADATVHFDLHHLLPLTVKNKTAQITAGHSFHFKELHLGFREFHLMFLRRAQKPDGRWAKQVSKERHRLGEGERWQSSDDKAISNGGSPKCLQSAGGGETGGETQTGCCGCWRPPAVPERTCTCKLWDTPSLRPSHEWGQRWRQRQQPSLHIFPWQLGQGFRGVVWVRSNKVFDSPLFLVCFPFVGWNFAFEFVVTTATQDLRETDGVPSWLKTCGRTKHNQQKHRSADKQINHQEHYA